MSALRSLAALDRLRSAAPRSLAAGARRVTGSAVSNARRSIGEIGKAVEERRQLTDGLTAVAGPGDLTQLTLQECRELLTSRAVGRLVYVARKGVPDIVPVNYTFDGHAILIRSGAGPKLQAAQRRDVVAFEVDQIDEESHTGWSVVVIGQASLLRPEDIGPERRIEPWASGPRRSTVRIDPRRIHGRRLL